MTGPRTTVPAAPAVPAAELLGAGRAALAAGAWDDARQAFEALVEHGPDPEALAGLGDALWWLGETESAIGCQERAYVAYRRLPDPVQSTLAAISLYFLYRVSLGNTAAARGWLSRAARIVAEGDLAPLAGWILLLRAHDSGDPGASCVWARHARRMARRFADRDLELCALSQLGAALVQAGRSAEGTALLDEAMAAALAGEGDRLHTVVYVSCNVIGACAEIADVHRAVQWIRAADGFARRYGAPHLYTHCRIYHGAALFAAGDWPAAERELASALQVGAEAEPALYDEALIRLAELRLAQGRLEEAEQLIEGCEHHAASARVVAELRLARGQSAPAERIASRRLRELSAREHSQSGSYRTGGALRLEAAALVELVATARLERGDAAAARDAVRALERLAAVTGYDEIRARAERALGRVAAAVSPAGEGSAVALERALAAFARLAMPFEEARTRLLLAEVLRDRDAAVAEAADALASFEALGAAREADAAAALLRSQGVVAVRAGAPGADALTRREREVLELLGEGLSNRELAERLFLTRKTVEHHVHAVLTKLGLRNRAEAAAYVARRRNRAVT